MLHSLSQSIHKARYIGTVDPGAVGTGVEWLDTNSDPAIHKKRDAGDTGWDTILDPSDYAELASPALTGTPTAPTAAAATDTTQIATTAFVHDVVTNNIRDVAIPVVIGNGVDVISTGIVGYLEVPFACTVVAVRLLAKEAGAIVVDIWKDTYANYPPTDADTITASAVPTITATNIKSEDVTLTGWTTSIAAGNILGFNVDSVTTCTQVTLSLTVRRTS
jgi:hypothetical protein